MKVQHLIVDTNAFLKNIPLHELGENIYTTREVIAEIRDSATRQMLEVLPYELQFREPHSEYVAMISKLSKVTGDYSSLSAVDIKLIALAYQITKEELGGEGLKTELGADSFKKLTVMGAGPQLKKQEESVLKELDVNATEKLDAEGEDDEDEAEVLKEDCTTDEDDGDEEGWITPLNYKQKIKELQFEGKFEDPTEDSVACLTNDFSMQNLMLHVGIKVLSSNGLLITQLRTYILRCYTCFSTTSKMDKLFCPKCGHKTLKRVSVTVNPDGSQVIHLSHRVNITGKGKKFPLPTPKGGKHANNPILVQDQPIPHQRPSKQAMERNNPLNFEYIAGNSPFIKKDVYSRAAMLGINHSGKNYWDKKNPNEPKKSGSKKKTHA